MSGIRCSSVLSGILLSGYWLLFVEGCVTVLLAIKDALVVNGSEVGSSGFHESAKSRVQR